LRLSTHCINIRYLLNERWQAVSQIVAFFCISLYKTNKLNGKHLENQENFIIKSSSPADSAQFYLDLCSAIVAQEKTPSLDADEQQVCQQICCDEFIDLSKQLDQTEIQESCSVRNVIKARRIAAKLVGDDGHLRHDLLSWFIQNMKERLYSLAPGREADAVRDEHILRVLLLLQNNKELVRIFSSISRPVANRLAEQIVRETLLLPPSTSVTDTHVKRACLSAWLTMLRQSLGSCFATAPAILVQQEQPESFLKDIEEMMYTGCMKRVFGGVEHSVPMSLTWGNGDLKKPFVLEKDLEYEEKELWLSPGLLEALSATKFFPEGLEEQKKPLVLKDALIKVSKRLEAHTCAEEILKAILFDHYKISQREVDEFLLRPKSLMPQSGLVMTSQKSLAKGKENPVPLFLADFEKAKFAFKSLADNPLLKSWEFTLASFSQINVDFFKWNLYTSLGVNYDDQGGIGQCLHQIIARKIEVANADLQGMQDEYNLLAMQMNSLEARARSASTEKEINWVKMEYQSRQTELYHINQMREAAHEKATKISRLHQFLIDEYGNLFCHYFQEVYDADLHDIAAGPFDDSPAGFRLIFKHGRSNPSLWTRIMSLPEFVEALVSFFTITESELRTKPDVKGIENDLSLIITQLIGHVRSDEFLESAFYRMAKAHGGRCPEKPLENLEKVEKKPWVYTSGGSMAVLVSAYFRREEKPTETSRWVENETELAAFFIDTVRQLPQKTQELFVKDHNKSLLIHSPTHAFLLKPGFFHESWNTDMYSYSWIKHRLIEPQVREIERHTIEEEAARDLIEELQKMVPHNYRPRFRQVFERLPYSLSSSDFRFFVVDAIYSDRGLKTKYGPVISQDQVDATLYSSFPYMRKEDLRGAIDEVIQALYPKERERFLEAQDEVLKRISYKGVISAKNVLQVLKASILLGLGSTRAAKNIQGLCIKALRERGHLLLKPFIFADSNWVKDYFAFVVSPASLQLELWSVDFYGISGRPISYWKMWVNGSKREPQWGIYYKPHEYVKNMLAKRREI
jgi:hypothetical protein